MGKKRKTTSFEILATSLREGSYQERPGAAKALGQSHDDRALFALCAQLAAEEHAIITVEIVRALIRLGDEAAAPALAQAFHVPKNEHIRDHLIDALKTLGATRQRLPSCRGSTARPS